MLVSLLGGSSFGQTSDPAVRLLGRAQQLYDAGDPAGAVAEAAVVLGRFPDSEWADDALLLSYRAHVDLGDEFAAQRDSQRIATDYGSTTASAAIQVLVARKQTRERLDGRTELIALRDELNRIPILWDSAAFPDFVWRSAALVTAAEVDLLLGEPAAAEAHFAGGLAPEAQPEFRAEALLGLGRLLLLDGRWNAAAGLLQRALDQGSAPATARGRALLALAHRHILRPALGGEIWDSARAIDLLDRELRRPSGVATSGAGDIVLTDSDLETAMRLDTDLMLLDAVALRGDGHPWFDRRGASYLTDGLTVADFASTSFPAFLLTDDNEPKPPENIRAGARGWHGDWFLLFDNGDSLGQFGEDGRLIRRLLDPGGDALVDVAIDSQGRLLVLDRREKTVQRYSPEGELEGTLLDGEWGRAEAITTDDLGNIYVLDRDQRQIHVYGPEGDTRIVLGPTLPGGIELRRPEDLAVDRSGRLLVADRDARALIVLE